MIFWMYLKLGFEHISDLKGYDHILFLFALTVVYVFRDIKKVLVLVTAFTVGHSVTLALATLHILKINTALIEFLIPVTIFISAIADFFYKDNTFSKNLHLFKYFSAFFFGLIHGLGFSNYLRALLGNEDNILKPLLAFNLGVEAGQIIIVFTILCIISFFINIIKTKRRDLVLVLSGSVFGIAIVLMIERMYFL